MVSATENLSLRLFNEGIGDLAERARDFNRRFSPDNWTVPRVRESVRNAAVRAGLSFLGADEPMETAGYPGQDIELGNYFQVRETVERVLNGDYGHFVIERTSDPIYLDGNEVYAKYEENVITLPAGMTRAREDYVVAHEIAEEVYRFREESKLGKRKPRLTEQEHVDMEGKVLTALYELSMAGNEQAGEAYDEGLQMHDYRLNPRKYIHDRDRRLPTDAEKAFSDQSVQIHEQLLPEHEEHRALLNSMRTYWN